jgi:hypothetical protein
MSVYTVHEPPLRADEQSADPHRIVFVRDGFYFWAFLLTPLWLLWRGLWLALVLYLALVAALEWAARAAGASSAAMFAIAALVSLLVGLEAGSLRRWALARRGWKNIGLVIGDDAEAAERRFFDSWTGEAAAAPAVPTLLPASVPAGRMPQAPDIIGLFPQPGARR